MSPLRARIPRRLAAIAASFLAGCGAVLGPDPHFRVVSYNVLVGFQDHETGSPYLDGETRKARAFEFLAREQPHVVALQELNGYTEARLEEECRAWGHRHAVLLKPNGYPTGLTSRFPIEVLQRKLSGMHHGLMRVRTAGIDFIVVHLWPFAKEQRLREIRPALSMYERARGEGFPVIMLGDFNAVSSADVPLFDAQALARYARWKWETDGAGRPRTDVLDACAAAGLVDLWAKHRGPFPEPMSLPRVDFILASPDLAARSRGARWLAAPELLKVSDHPAVVADFGYDTSAWRRRP